MNDPASMAHPLKAWGEVLAARGKWQAALAKYDEALRFAPAWAELHQARQAAARKTGANWSVLRASRLPE